MTGPWIFPICCFLHFCFSLMKWLSLDFVFWHYQLSLPTYYLHILWRCLWCLCPIDSLILSEAGSGEDLLWPPISFRSTPSPPQPAFLSSVCPPGSLSKPRYCISSIKRGKIVSMICSEGASACPLVPDPFPVLVCCVESAPIHSTYNWGLTERFIFAISLFSHDSQRLLRVILLGLSHKHWVLSMHKAHFHSFKWSQDFRIRLIRPWIPDDIEVVKFSSVTPFGTCLLPTWSSLLKLSY